jgi:hypothetical protein
VINREAIYAALFAKLAASGGYVTTDRRLKHWADVPKENQPALFMAQTGEIGERATGQPTKWTLSVDVYVYCRAEEEAAPGPIINPLLDSIEAALEPTVVESVQTLGGLVHHCRINGAIETDEGTLGAQAVAIIPITITVS